MRTIDLLFGAAVAALLSGPAIAETLIRGAVMTSTIDGKEVLTDARGMTLYTFDRDTRGVSNCYNECAVNWPPLMASDGATPVGEFTLVNRTDGGRMWAYKGWPLYHWAGDARPGDMLGDGVGGVWHTAHQGIRLASAQHISPVQQTISQGGVDSGGGGAGGTGNSGSSGGGPSY